MVFERDIPSCSPREVLIRYLRRILQQVQNGIDSDCISFRLENLIDLLLRSAHKNQDGGQVLAVLRAALMTVEKCRQSEDDPTIWGSLSREALFANFLFCAAFLRVLFMPLCVVPFCVWPLCVRLFSLSLFTCCLFALCPFACCIFAWCLLACWLFAWCLFALCLLRYAFLRVVSSRVPFQRDAFYRDAFFCVIPIW